LKLPSSRSSASPRPATGRKIYMKRGRFGMKDLMTRLVQCIHLTKNTGRASWTRRADRTSIIASVFASDAFASAASSCAVATARSAARTPSKKSVCSWPSAACRGPGLRERSFVQLSGRAAQRCAEEKSVRVGSRLVTRLELVELFCAIALERVELRGHARPLGVLVLKEHQLS
jgi:hypothetical protein